MQSVRPPPRHWPGRCASDDGQPSRHQPEGGRFDGVYGVLAGLEVVRCLYDQKIKTRKPLEVTVWTNEEGARFTPAMFGSAVFTGIMDLDAALAVRDANGISVAEELKSLGYAGDRPLGGAVEAYFEAHIEQGPILDDNAAAQRRVVRRGADDSGD